MKDQIRVPTVSTIWIDRFFQQLVIHDIYGSHITIDLAAIEHFIDQLHFVLREHYTDFTNPDPENFE